MPAGPRSVLVHAYPTFLSARGVEPADFVPGLLSRIAEDGPGDLESALSDVLDMMACKAAVKAGDRLSPAEIDGLLDLRERIERSSSCPHGRPASRRISMRDVTPRHCRGSCARRSMSQGSRRASWISSLSGSGPAPSRA